jgi:hypothetical protein
MRRNPFDRSLRNDATLFLVIDNLGHGNLSLLQFRSGYAAASPRRPIHFRDA